MEISRSLNQSHRMKIFKNLILTVLVLQAFSSHSQSYWKIEIENGNEILLTLDINTEKKTFTAFTRKGALKELGGIISYTLAKAAGRIKYAEIVYIEGKIQNSNDSLLLNGTFHYFEKQYQFSATISEIRFKGRYLDNKNKVHQLTGIKMLTAQPIKDYVSIINAAFSITERTLFNREWLKSDEWLSFRKRVNELKPKISDDYELAATFYWLGKKLPFSPFEISRTSPQKKLTERKGMTGLREIKANTAIFDQNTLPVNKKEMDSLGVIIEKKGYRNLIIDLRGNARLNPCTANILGNYLSDKPFVAGVYLTRKWFDGNKTIPGVQEYIKSFKSLSDPDFIVGELHKEPGRYLNIVPNRKSFGGKVYILTNSKTTKAAEVLIYVLKRGGVATIIGEKMTAVSILSESLLISSEYELVLPVSDFYNVDRKKLNKIDVEPDMIVSGEDALRYILKIL